MKTRENNNIQVFCIILYIDSSSVLFAVPYLLFSTEEELTLKIRGGVLSSMNLVSQFAHQTGRLAEGNYFGFEV